jgi:hypothetical protein
MASVIGRRKCSRSQGLTGPGPAEVIVHSTEVKPRAREQMLLANPG